jgi:hypothetical protein
MKSNSHQCPRGLFKLDVAVVALTILPISSSAITHLFRKTLCVEDRGLPPSDAAVLLPPTRAIQIVLSYQGPVEASMGAAVKLPVLILMAMVSTNVV